MVAMAGLKLFETGRSFPLDIEPMPRLKFN